MENSPNWLAQATGLFTNYVLLPMRYADYTRPWLTFALVVVICLVGCALWQASNKVKNQWGWGILRIFAVIAAINVITIGFISLKVWGGF